MIKAALVESKSFSPQFVEEQVDQFVERQRQYQYKRENEMHHPHQTIADLVNKSRSLPPEVVDNIFNPYLSRKIDDDSIAYVRKRLHSMRLKINTLDAKKRFLVLETMDFFRNKISIGKLIPAILLLEGVNKKKAFLQFVVPTFFSINKNIEELVSINQLFVQKTLHLNRGSLYSFISDLATAILPVFKKTYLERFAAVTSPVELLTNALKPYSNGDFAKRSSFYNCLVEDEITIRKVLLDFIVAIQSHEALFNYAVKRQGYHRLLLCGLTDKNRFQECEPVLVSKILAGCFIANEQMNPATSLIDAMVDKDRFADSSTVKAKKSFIEKLAPSTLANITNQFKTYFRLLINPQSSNRLDEINELSVKSILKNVWNGFIKLADEGFTKLSAPLVIVLNQIKKNFNSFLADESRVEEQVKNRLHDPLVILIPKREEIQTYLKKTYSMVTPDIIGFRGFREGANQKDFAYNARFFNRGEVTLLEFKFCFNRLFESLVCNNNNKKVKAITHNSQKKIVEYHASFLCNQYLVCLGLTRLKSDKYGEVQEKDIFPYVLLFAESADKKAGRIPNRVLTERGKRRIFKETVLQSENSKVFYNSILHILHLLPIEDWNASASQACIKFIIRELKKQTDHF